MSAEDAELRERVERLERQVASLQAELQQRLAPPAAPPPPPAAPPRRDLEAHLGSYWLSRAGILAFITGLALLVTYRFEHLGPLLRVALGYGLALGLAAVGRWVGRRQRVLGQLLFAGGLALGYFVTYALHFVPAMRLVPSEAAALVLLALYVLGIIAIAQRLHSETVAGISLFLGLHLGLLSDVTAFTLLSTSLLALGALYFLVKNQWVIVPLSSLVAVYTTHLAWSLRAGQGELELSLGFLGVDFALFTLALLVRPRKLPARTTVLFALLNWVAFLALGAWELERQRPGHLLGFLLLLTGVLVLAALVAHVRAAPAPLVHAQLACALVTLALALPQHFDRGALVLAWALVAVGGALLARVRASPVLALLACLTLAAALARAWWEGPAPAAPVLLLLALAFVAVERLRAAVLSRLPAPMEEGEWGRRGRVLLAAGAGLALVRLTSSLLPGNLTTLAWVAAAGVLFAVGFPLREARYRWAGLLLVGLALVRLVVYDLAGLAMDLRILTFLLLGAGLLVLSWVYTRLRGGAQEG